MEPGSGEDGGRAGGDRIEGAGCRRGRRWGGAWGPEPEPEPEPGPRRPSASCTQEPWPGRGPAPERRSPGGRLPHT